MDPGKILILGSKGMLGQQLMDVFGASAVGWDRTDVDVTKAAELGLKVKELSPGVIINCVAYNDVDGAENNQEQAFSLNAEVPLSLAKIAKELDRPLVHFSTSYVFDGERGNYQENDKPSPVSVYAKSKYQGELFVRQNCEKFYIIRTAVLFGQRGASSQTKKSFVQLMLDLAEKTDAVRAVSDEINNTTSAADLAWAVKQFLQDNRPYGIYHITNSGQASWYEYAKEIFAITGKKIKVIAVPRTEFPRKARTPANGTLINTKLPPLRSWQEALREFLLNNGQ